MKPLSKTRWVKLIAAMVGACGTLCYVVLCGCTTNTGNSSAAGAHDADAEVIRFKNWWNFYERGTSRMLHDELDGARADFETCLELRAGARFGNLKDARRVRTYGVHILDGYFPNRELGICLFTKQDFAGAAKYLEKSIGQAPSARAKFYLNQVRKQFVLARPASEPNISISGPPVSSPTREFKKQVVGIVKSGNYISGLSINGLDDYIELAEPTRAFSKEIRLQEGTNIVPLIATDLAGRSSTTTLVIVADWTPPQLAIRSIVRDGQEWIVEGTLFDDSGIRTASLGSSSLVVAGTSDHFVQFKRRMKVDETTVLLAEDAAGNKLITELDPQRRSTRLPRRSDALEYAQAVQAIEATATDAREKRVRPNDMLAPDLQLMTPSFIVTENDRFALEANVNDGGGIASIMLNGEERLQNTLKGCQETRFAITRGGLKVGTNVFVLTAQDMNGNLTDAEIRVVRRKPIQLMDQTRPVIAIPQVEADGVPQLAEPADRYLNDGIRLLDPKRFLIVDRKDMQTILTEHKLSTSSLADSKTRLEIGRLKVAEMFFLGRIVQEGCGVTFHLDVADTETGVYREGEEVYSDTLLAKDLKSQTDVLALKVSQRFPMLEGTISSVKGSRIQIQIGEGVRLRENHRFVILVRTAEGTSLLKLGDNPVLARVTGDGDSIVFAEVIPSSATSLLKVGQSVYTK